MSGTTCRQTRRTVALIGLRLDGEAGKRCRYSPG
jgi:hypothetical protein